jgi:RES domain-containing protein
MASIEELPAPPASIPGALPVTEIAQSRPWWRIHRSEHPPVFFGPPEGQPPTYRFDAPGGEYRILYLGQTLSAAFVETLLRNPRIPFVERAELEKRSSSLLTHHNALKLVDLRGGGWSRIGVDSRLTSGSYTRAGQWALALWSHPDQPDGLLYRSRHDPNHICAALFDRPSCRFSVHSTHALMEIPHQWASILHAHGKGIA